MPKTKADGQGKNGHTEEVIIPDGSVGAMLQMKMAEAEARQSDDGPVVVCDFSEVSRRWAHEWTMMDGELQQWTAVVASEARDDLTEAQQADLQAGRLEAFERINQLLIRRNELAAMVVKDVPREWLVKRAPEVIDWSNPDNLLDYVKDKHNVDLLRGITQARARSAKN